MIIPVDYAQITYVFSGTAAPTGAVVTVGVDASGAASAQAVANSAKAAWDDNVMIQMASSLVHSDTIAKLGPNDTGPQANSAGSVSGSNSGAACPPQVAYLCRKQTAHGGRHGRGRLYIPGVIEAEVTPSGALDPTQRTNVENALLDWMTHMEDNGIPIVLLHSDATTPYPITGLALESTVATQRRRLRR